jgi:hypothetical protein
VAVTAPVPPCPIAKVPPKSVTAPPAIKSQVEVFHLYTLRPLLSINIQPSGKLVQVPPVLSAVVPLRILPP